MHENRKQPTKDATICVSIEQLIQQHYEVLYRYAFRLTGRHNDAEDLTQQCFLTAHRKLSQLRQVEAARGWLFTILRTAFLKLVRKKRPHNEIDTELPMQEVAQEKSESPFDLEHLQQRLNELPETYRIALLMFYFEGKSYEEIAAETNVALGTVMSRLSRAKAHLRTRLRPIEA